MASLNRLVEGAGHHRREDYFHNSARCLAETGYEGLRDLL
jgi:hypothetical protein